MPQVIQNTLQTVWGWPVIIYLFLAGVGAGAYLTSWWSGLRGIKGPLAAVGRYVAPPLVAVGTVFLIFDLGAGRMHALRIFGLYTHPTSMMSLGSWILTIFLILAVIDAYGPFAHVRRTGWLGAVTAVFAGAVAIYTGALLGVIRAIPFWNNALLPVLFVLSALSTGLAASFLGALLADTRTWREIEAFGGLHVAVVATEAVVLALFLLFAANGPDAARFSYRLVVGGRFAAAFWVGFVAIGLAVPLVYGLLSRTRSLTRILQAPAWVAVESVLVLVGGFYLRYLIVSAGATGRILG